jgi:hypothetical protein
MVSRRVRRVLKKFRNIARDKQSVRNPNYAVASRMVSEINSTVHQLYTEDDYETLKKLFEILQMDITGYEDKKYQVITEVSSRLNEDFENTVWLPCRKAGIIDEKLKHFEK